MNEFAGKNVLVVGASTEGGMGEAVARKFAAAGAQVTVSGLGKEPLARLAAAIGGRAMECDFTDEAQIKALVSFAAKNSPLDIAVNASGLSVRTPLREVSQPHLLQMAHIHFIGPALFIRYVAENMVDDGAIINFSSLSAFDPLPGYGGYASSKAGGDRIVKAAAVEYAAKRLRINGIVPSLVPSPMSIGAMAAQGLDMEKFAQGFADLTPLGRVARPDDIANMVAMMASDSYFETGQIVFCTGGNALLGHPRRKV